MDPYRILGVSRGCSREEVRAAFRAAGLRLHPDHGGEDAAFIRLLDAYKQVLAELDRGDQPDAEPPSARPHDRSATAPPEVGILADVQARVIRQSSGNRRRGPGTRLGGRLRSWIIDRPAVLAVAASLLIAAAALVTWALTQPDLKSSGPPPSTEYVPASPSPTGIVPRERLHTLEAGPPE